MSSASDPFLEKRRASFSSGSVTFDDLDENLSACSLRARRPQNKSHVISLSLRVCIVVLALWGVVAMVIISILHRRQGALLSKPDVYHPTSLPPDANSCDCGTTLESAIAKGCKYDSLATAWLPDSCRDDELTADFEISGPEPDGSWPYWADRERTHRLTLEEVAALGPEGGYFWATREWHVAHCMFYWRKLYRMRFTGAIMERRFDSEHHITHCGRLAMKDKPKSIAVVNVPVQMNSAAHLPPKSVTSER